MTRGNFTLPIEEAENLGKKMPILSEWDVFLPKGIKSGEEGKLGIDVVETKEELVIIAAMAGTAPENLELHLQNDLLTIRGERQMTLEESADYHHKEIFWGKFSRTIVLPAEVRQEMARAEYKHGVLIIHLPKVSENKNIPIVIVEE